MRMLGIFLIVIAAVYVERAVAKGRYGGMNSSLNEPHRTPRDHVHAVDRGARGDLEFAPAMRGAAN